MGKPSSGFCNFQDELPKSSWHAKPLFASSLTQLLHSTPSIFWEHNFLQFVPDCLILLKRSFHSARETRAPCLHAAPQSTSSTIKTIRHPTPLLLFPLPSCKIQCFPILSWYFLPLYSGFFLCMNVFISFLRSHYPNPPPMFPGSAVGESPDIGLLKGIWWGCTPSNWPH